MARLAPGSLPPRDQALAAVARGDYRVCVVLPKGLSAALRKKVDRLAEQAADLSGARGDSSPKAQKALGEAVEVVFDPTVPESYRRSVANGVGRAAQGVEMKWLFRALSEAVAGPYGAAGSPAEGMPLWEPGRLLEVREGFAGATSAEKVPTSVQQNVPGWSLFAMFLIAIPLSCNLIKERDSGTLLRLRMLPVRYETVLLAKALTYVLFCLCQFGFILLIGLYLLPRLGTPKLELGGHYVALAAAAAASGLAATAFGVLVGSVARTTDQATIFGTTFAVIGGAVAGVMIPSFLMPRAIQRLGPYSPLHWGLDAFLSVFLRGAGLVQILPDLARLLVFAVACVVGAAFWLSRREDSPAGFLFWRGP